MRSYSPDITPRGQLTGSRMQDEDELLFNWLKGKREFVHNPFPSTDTERDRFLHRHFLKLPIFDQCLKLAHTIIVAATGAGKSALAWAITRHFATMFTSRRVIAATHTVYLPADGRPLELTGYLQQLLETLVRQTFIILAQFGNDLPQLRKQPALAAVFAHWFDQYVGYRLWREDLDAAIEEKSLRQSLTSLNLSFDPDAPPAASGTVSAEWLQVWRALLDDPSEPPAVRYIASPSAEPLMRFRTFIALLIEVGVREVILLIDGFDPHGGRDPRETILKLVRPLLALLKEGAQAPHLHLKLFLPDDIGKPEEVAALLQLPASVDILPLKWGRKQLRELLKARLSYASDGAVKSLNQVIDDKSRDFDRLVLEGGHERRGRQMMRARSPRELLHQARRLIVAYALRPDPPQPRLNPAGQPQSLPSPHTASWAPVHASEVPQYNERTRRWQEQPECC